MSAEYRAPLTRPLKMNVEYARSLHPIRLQRQITRSYTGLSSCGRSISAKTNLHRLLAPCDTDAISRMLRRNSSYRHHQSRYRGAARARIERRRVARGVEQLPG